MTLRPAACSILIRRAFCVITIRRFANFACIWQWYSAIKELIIPLHQAFRLKWIRTGFNRTKSISTSSYSRHLSFSVRRCVFLDKIPIVKLTLKLTLWRSHFRSCSSERMRASYFSVNFSRLLSSENKALVRAQTLRSIRDTSREKHLTWCH